MLSDKIKVEWERVESTPEEIESRLSKAFEILFKEVLKKRKLINDKSHKESL